MAQSEIDTAWKYGNFDITLDFDIIFGTISRGFISSTPR